jgi:type III restriction enzyme
MILHTSRIYNILQSWRVANFFKEFYLRYTIKAVGSIKNDSIKKLQIRKTIEEHLNKELRLNPKDIKALSLFFLDRVGNYKQYDKNKNFINGKFANCFEEKYNSLFNDVKFIQSDTFDNFKNATR